MRQCKSCGIQDEGVITGDLSRCRHKGYFTGPQSHDWEEVPSMADNPEQPAVTLPDGFDELSHRFGSETMKVFLRLVRAVVREQLASLDRMIDESMRGLNIEALDERLEELQREFTVAKAEWQAMKEEHNQAWRDIAQGRSATDPESFIRGQEFERNIQARRWTVKAEGPWREKKEYAKIEMQPEWCQHHRPRAFHVGDGRYLDAYASSREEGSPAVIITDLIIYCPYCGQRRPS